MMNKLKIWTFFTTIFVLGCLVNPRYVDAHVLKTDGSIGAVIHIDPEDDPIAGQPAAFFFEIKDKQNRYQPDQCDCQVVIEQQGKTIFQSPLTTIDLTSASFTYTFPERGMYTVTVIGKPLDQKSFQSFTLVDDIRVERVSTPAGQQTNRLTPIALALSAIIILVLLISLDKKRRKENV